MTNVPDWLAALAIVVPAATGILGYLLAGVNEEKRDKRAAEREREARRAIVVQQAGDRRHEFQREVLLELQDVLRQYMRASIELSNCEPPSPFAFGEAVYAAGLDLGRLCERVLDDGLRQDLLSFQDHCTRLQSDFLGLDAQSPRETINELRSQQAAATRLGVKVNGRLGEQLRQELGRVPELESPPDGTE